MQACKSFIALATGVGTGSQTRFQDDQASQIIAGRNALSANLYIILEFIDHATTHIEFNSAPDPFVIMNLCRCR